MEWLWWAWQIYATLCAVVVTLALLFFALVVWGELLVDQTARLLDLLERRRNFKGPEN